MKFSCPHCGQHIAVETMHQGAAAQCPNCGGDLTVPDKADAIPEEAVQTMQSSIDRADRTISQYMQEQKLEGGVDLSEAADGDTASKYLTAEQGRKYKLGKVIATGGMGAILDAKEHNLRRSVAMKVVLNAENATKEHILRFIEEAQVTAQLQHPSIVPIYELGVDVSGNVFYTMKMIMGVTLKDILKRIDDGDEDTVAQYPLSRLLTIFQRVCDAMAFAHHKHVIHRDLKPENIMVAEYGEVQVMDWGLAKVLGKPEREEAEDDKTMRLAIDSVRKDDSADIMKTMDGAIMGTPGFMAPEQAEGALGDVDERSDIYALGAILYNILTLNKPIASTTLDEFIERVSAGDIPHPTIYNPTKSKRGKVTTQPAGPEDPQVSLSHCPSRRIPDSLAAVAMKALATDRKARYESVKELQTDVEAYQNGFATSAEAASAWKLVRLFVRRNKLAAGLSAIVLLAVLLGGIVAGAQWMRAEKNLANFKNEQSAHSEVRQQAAPRFVAEAQKLVDQGRWEDAFAPIDIALALDDGNEQAWFMKARLHLARVEAQDAIAALEKSGDHGNILLAAVKALPRLSNVDDKEKLLTERNALATAVRGAGDYALAAELAKNSQEDLKHAKARLEPAKKALKRLNPQMENVRFGLDRVWIRKVTDLSPLRGLPITWIDAYALADKSGGITELDPLQNMPLRELFLVDHPFTSDQLKWLKDMPLTKLGLRGCFKIDDLSALDGLPLTSLDLTGTKVTDISAVKGMPLKVFKISHGPKVDDISPLEDMPLESLYLCDNPVTNIGALKGMPLKYLSLKGTKVSDLSALSGMPLITLYLQGTQVTDLSALKGMPLSGLSLHGMKVTDLSPLKGMPLRSLSLYGNPVTDISALKDVPLRQLSLYGTQVTDISVLKSMPLTKISLPLAPENIAFLRDIKTLENIDNMPAQEFWKKYDAEQKKKAAVTLK